MEGFEKILGRPISGSLLSAPMLMPNGESDRSLLLLTPESDRSWTAADQNHLADIAGSLAGIIDLKNLSQSNAEQLAQTSSTLQNIQDENDRLNDELIEMSSRYNSSEQKVEQLQIELRKLMDDLEMDPTSQTQDKGLPE
jgi:peptidoglycan hydrolase CwlO-like protein